MPCYRPPVVWAGGRAVQVGLNRTWSMVVVVVVHYARWCGGEGWEWGERDGRQDVEVKTAKCRSQGLGGLAP